jgi:hypothetical protein
MASQNGASETPTEYIVHHLTHLKVGQGFWTVHIDTLLMSSLLAAAVAAFLFIGVRRGSAVGAPSGLRNFVEMIYEFIDGQVSDIYHGNRAFLVALALSLFTWVVAMNSMDLLPLDLPGSVAALFGAEYFRVLPTADLNGTVAMAIVVLFLIIIYAIRAKGVGGYPCTQHRRAAGETGVALNATVRQHVRGRAAFHAHRLARYGVRRIDRRHFFVYRTDHRRHRLGDLPHSDRAASGLHLHGSAHRVHLDGRRASLIVKGF